MPCLKILQEFGDLYDKSKKVDSIFYKMFNYGKKSMQNTSSLYPPSSFLTNYSSNNDCGENDPDYWQLDRSDITSSIIPISLEKPVLDGEENFCSDQTMLKEKKSIVNIKVNLWILSIAILVLIRSRGVLCD